jgi:hypothetical protein
MEKKKISKVEHVGKKKGRKGRRKGHGKKMHVKK